MLLINLNHRTTNLAALFWKTKFFLIALMTLAISVANAYSVVTATTTEATGATGPVTVGESLPLYGKITFTGAATYTPNPTGTISFFQGGILLATGTVSAVSLVGQTLPATVFTPSSLARDRTSLQRFTAGIDRGEHDRDGAP